MSRGFDDASSEYLNGGTPVTAAPMTVSCWAYSDDNTLKSQNFVSIGNVGASTDVWGLDCGDPFGQPRWFAFDATFIAAVHGSSMSANTWHHLVGLEASVSSRFVYLDGVASAENTDNRSPDNADEIRISRIARSVEGGYVSGRVAEVGVWNVALTAAEIGVLAEGFSPLFVRPGSLVFYLPLLRDVDEDIVGATSMTANGTPTVENHPRIIYPSSQLVVPALAAVGGGLGIPIAAYHLNHHLGSMAS